ncbi:MAG: hypothetical protein NT007_07065 [Candidatus Kapabacteria bacterium]|nr:hypothetical protein [Candidatus Kapabacteria bacterium]
MKNAKWLNSGITGQVEHMTGGKIKNGHNELNLKIQDLVDGQYFVRITANNNIISLPFIINR